MLRIIQKTLLAFTNVVFAGMVVAGVMSMQFSPRVVIASGASAVAAMLAAALYVTHLINRKKKK